MMEFHHIGYMVADMDAARDEFTALGFRQDGAEVHDALREVRIAFMRMGGVLIELVCPASPGSPVAPLQKKLKNAPYHMCFRADDLESAQRELFARGYVPVRPPEPAAAFDGARVAFYMHGGIGMVEVLEKSLIKT